MSAGENVETVKGLYDAFRNGDVEAILAQCTDDVDWATDAAGHDAPWHGVRHGKDETVGFFEGIGSTIDVTEFTLNAIAATDTEVFAFLRFGFQPKAGGPSASMNLHHYWRLRDGKVEYYRGSEDTALTASVLAGAAV